ncbi:MAG: hypothetical protein GY725_23135 [bacterium]|nr:hypothetical protein [bacterium]
MPEKANRSLLHLIRAAEELLHAGAEAASAARRRVEHEEGAIGNGPAEILASLVGQLEGPALARLRGAVRDEIGRWSQRAASDPAAEKVRDLLAALLAAIARDEEAAEAQPVSPRPRAAPRRSTRNRNS